MAEQLHFRSWWRPGLSALIDAELPSDGAALEPRVPVTASLDLHHTPTDASSEVAASGELTAWLAGPLEVSGVRPQALAHRYPRPGTPDAETTSYAYAEFHDPGLPWRYTPLPNPDDTTSSPLRPWLWVVVGPQDALEVTGDRVSVDPGTQTAHPLGDAARWAHVQEADGTVLARVLSPRVLDPDTAYVAALVPTYREADDGRLVDAWDAEPTDAVLLPCYHSWRFTTGDGGDFRSLGMRLAPYRATAMGRIPTTYPRIADAPDFEVRGALTTPGEDVEAAPEVLADVDGLRTPAFDDDGRPIVGLPRYGAPWAEVESTTWGEQLNTDPRHRGVAGLGARTAADAEEDLVAEVTRQAGALAAADQTVRDTAFGLAASTRLWERRLPQDPARQVAVLGPGLRRVMTGSGSLTALATGPGRPLARSALSSAARRALRRGPARTALAQPEASDPAAALTAANRCPPPHEPEPGLAPPTGDRDLDAFLEAVRDGVRDGVDPKVLDPLFAHLRKLTRDQKLLERLRHVLLDRAADGQPLPLTALVVLAVTVLEESDPAQAAALLDRAVGNLLDAVDGAGDDPASLAALLELLAPPPPPLERCEPVEVSGLAAAARAAFDPRDPDALALRRLRARVTGLDPERPLVPLELCPGLDVAVWRYVSDQRPSWLLPGLQDAPDDVVLAVTTDATFTAAFLTGFNGTLVDRLRWRNLRIATGCTPVRTFWNRVDPGDPEDPDDGPQRLDDIRSIAHWPQEAALGGPATRPPGVADTDLVLVVSGALLLRYPQTVVYLAMAASDGGMDPTAPVVFPSFRGRIGEDAAFLGFSGLDLDDLEDRLVVFEEAPSGFRFRHDRTSTAEDGATVASDTFAAPIRLLMAGAAVRPPAAEESE